MNETFTVIIAEDEPEIRRSISEIVGSHPAFKVVFCAANGEECLNYMTAHPLPDVLITDIRMPGIDGLSLLERIREAHLPIHTIIISGYGSFEYAQRAIKYGVSDYLLKPVLPEDCLGTLDGVARLLMDGLNASFDLNLALSRRSVILPPHTDPLYLIAGCLGNYPFAPGVIHRDEDMLKRRLSAIASQMPPVAFYGIRNGIHYLLAEFTDTAAAGACLAAIASALKHSIPEEFNSLTLALSRPVENESLYSVASRLSLQMRQQALLCGTSILNMNLAMQTAAPQASFTTLFEVDEALISSIRCHDYAPVHALLRRRFEQWYQTSGPVSTLLDYVRYQYVYTGQKIYATADEPLPIPYEWEQRLCEKFTEYTSWETLCEAVFELFAEMFNAVQSVRTPRNIVREIETYINHNYTEHITNQTLARHFGFVPSYISRMFKSYKGVSPCEYLTMVRIEHAQQIIRESENVNFYEISYALGFSDSSYFSKIFKKQVGMTPTEYKNAL